MQSEELEDGEIIEDVTRTQDILIYNKLSKILTNIQKLFPDLISIKKIEKARSFFEESVYPTINLEFSTENSWLEMPTPEFSSDTVGFWPTNTVFPNSVRNVVPSKAQNEMPAKLPYKFIDNKLEKFFDADPLGHSKKIKLDSRVFETPEIPLPSDLSHVNNIDRISRRSLVENLLVDQFIDSANNHIGSILGEWDRFSQNPNELKQHLLIHYDMLQVALCANLRSRNFSIALFTANKLHFRDSVLKLFSGIPTSINILRGSCFAAPTLFGELPESFVTKLEQTHNTKTYLLTPVSSKGRSVAQKRGSFQYGYNFSNPGTFNNNYNTNKSFKPDMNIFNSNNASNTGKFSTNTNKIAGQSSKNANNNNQFFPSKGGRGRGKFTNHGKK